MSSFKIRGGRSPLGKVLLILTAALPLSLLFGTSGASAATTTAANLSPIPVGEIVEIQGTGLNWPFQEAVDKAAVRGINSRGGIKGHPIALHVCDAQNDPNVELQCARTLVSDGVVAVVGGMTETNGPAVDSYLNQNKIPMIGVFPLAQSDFQSPNEFLLSSGQFGIVPGELLNASHHGVKKIWSYEQSSSGSSLWSQLLKVSAPVAHVTIAGDSAIPATATNYTSYVEDAVSAGADGVMPALGPSQTATYILALNQTGAKTTLLNIDTEPANAIAAACGTGGGVCTGALGASSSLPATDSSNSGIKLFQKDLKAEAATGDSSAKPNQSYNSLAVQGWLGMEAFAKVAAGLPTITNQTVLQAFETAQNINLWNVVPAWTPNKSAGIAGYPRISSPYVYFVKLHSNLLPYLQNSTPQNVVKLVPGLAKL
jgi:ABC-type branched-subunit amino acid transport system substrate-binding protein